MLFCSREFLYFYLLVFLVYWSLPWLRVRTYLLLVASFYFYFSWSPGLAYVVCLSSLMDYSLARGMETTPSNRIRRLLLLVSIGGNLGLLGYFKYANFFLDSLERALQEAGCSAALPTLQVLLPIGISFYTFEAINYTVDVYRGHVKAERDPAKFLVFILFFPHLVAGPIVRARDFLPQIRRHKKWNWLRAELGIRLILLGLFKKLVIADRMALFADPIFAHAEIYRTYALWLGLMAYTLQVYCDFSGYSDLALGTAHLLGFRLAQNFNMPYVAVNIADFWRRWHMSLSSWLRDYVFFPLGGSRGGRWLTYRNLLITMTLCGLWHGANWTFVAFGVVHALMLIVHHSFQGWCRPRPLVKGCLDSLPGTVLRIVFTLFCFSTSLVIFRATTLTEAGLMLSRLFGGGEGIGTPLPGIGLWLTVAVVSAAHVWVLAYGWTNQRWGWAWLERVPAPVVGLSYVALLSLTLALAPEAGKAFIYFQF